MRGLSGQPESHAQRYRVHGMTRDGSMNASGNDVTAAVNRFGLGAKPGELAGIRDPREWLNAQIAHGSDAGNAFAGLPDSLDYLREEAQLLMRRREFKQGGQRRR